MKKRHFGELLLFKLQFIALSSVDHVGAIIDRPRGRIFVFALDFGEIVHFPAQSLSHLLVPRKCQLPLHKGALGRCRASATHRQTAICTADANRVGPMV